MGRRLYRAQSHVDNGIVDIVGNTSQGKSFLKKKIAHSFTFFGRFCRFWPILAAYVRRTEVTNKKDQVAWDEAQIVVLIQRERGNCFFLLRSEFFGFAVFFFFWLPCNHNRGEIGHFQPTDCCGQAVRSPGIIP